LPELPPTPLSCAEVLAQLDDCIDRELSEDRVRLVQAHLERCTECAARNRFERAWIAAARQKLGSIDLPRDVRDRIARALAAAAREPDAPPRH
jgi:anti-sigma factor RsiW